MAQAINVRIHMPETAEGKEELQTRMADAIAIGICNIINTAPAHHRRILYEGVMDSIRSGEFLKNGS